MPTAAEKPSASATAHHGVCAGGKSRDQRRGERADAVAEHESREPAEQAQHERLEQELQKDVMAFAPMALRMPISRVRSVTDTSMMFMIPMPPTSSEMPTMPVITIVTVVRIESNVSWTCSAVWIRKSSSSSGLRSCALRSRRVIVCADVVEIAQVDERELNQDVGPALIALQARHRAVGDHARDCPALAEDLALRLEQRR